MITKWIQFTVEPTQAEDFHRELVQLEQASKAENGCEYYAAFRDTSTPAIFTVLEIWDSESAFEAHRVAPHVAAFKETCGATILEKSGQSLAPVAAPE